MRTQTEGLQTNQLEVERSLNETETLDFLINEGVDRVEKFKPHTPIFYVFEEIIRKDNGPFKDLPPDKRPSLAVVHDPIKLDFNMPIDSGNRNVFALENKGGKVDFYAIDPKTHKLTLVGTENKTKMYHVKKDHMFEALTADLLPEENW